MGRGGWEDGGWGWVAGTRVDGYGVGCDDQWTMKYGAMGRGYV